MKTKQFWSDLGGKLGVGLIGAGFLLVFLGWNGAASVDRVPSQFPYLISGGVGGLCLVVCGVGVLVVQNQRADRAELQATLRELRRAIDGSEDETVPVFEPPSPRLTPPEYVVADGDADDDPDGTGRRGRRKPLRAGGG